MKKKKQNYLKVFHEALEYHFLKLGVINKAPTEIVLNGNGTHQTEPKITGFENVYTDVNGKEYIVTGFKANQTDIVLAEVNTKKKRIVRTWIALEGVELNIEV
jgi:hypothetical protein